jgi:hypothetical protein
MVEVLARRLEGQVKVSTGSRGTSVIILGPVGRESTSAGRAVVAAVDPGGRPLKLYNAQLIKISAVVLGKGPQSR